MARLLAAFGALAVSLAVMAAPAPKDNRPLQCFPTKVGAKLVYRVTDDDEPEKAPYGKEVLVTGVEEKYGTTIVEAEQWHVASDGIRDLTCKLYMNSSNEEVSVSGVYDPPLRLLKLPVKSEDAWDWSRAFDVRNKEIWERRYRMVKGIEDVLVPAGKFKAVRVDVTICGTIYPRQSSREWYVLGLGRIKQVNCGYTEELVWFVDGSAGLGGRMR
jgi:hypothetical protein